MWRFKKVSPRIHFWRMISLMENSIEWREQKDQWKVAEFLEILPESGLSLIGFRKIATLNMNDSIQVNQLMLLLKKKKGKRRRKNKDTLHTHSHTHIQIYTEIRS